MEDHRKQKENVMPIEQRPARYAWISALLLCGLPFLCAIPTTLYEGSAGLILLALYLVIAVAAFFWFRPVFQNAFTLLLNKKISSRKLGALRLVFVMLGVLALALCVVFFLPPRALRISVRYAAPQARVYYEANSGAITDGMPYVLENESRIRYTFRHAPQGVPQSGYQGQYRYDYAINQEWVLEIYYPPASFFRD